MILLVLSYLLGSIPFGLLVAKYVKGHDIRKTGSGNIGATNVFRTSGKALGLLTFFLDMAKGIPTVLLADGNAWLEWGCALMVMLGHIFPVWLKFRGGKGVATYIGVVMALNFKVGASMIILWLSCLVAFRISSLGSLVSTGLAPFLSLLWSGGWQLFFLTLGLSTLVWARHWANIKRLWHGKETKIISKK